MYNSAIEHMPWQILALVASSAGFFCKSMLRSCNLERQALEESSGEMGEKPFLEVGEGVDPHLKLTQIHVLGPIVLRIQSNAP